MGLGGPLGAPVPWNLHVPSRLPQSLFERQGLPGPEKLPGSLRKGIPRTKSVGMAGLGSARGREEWGWAVARGDLGLEDPFCLHLQLGFPVSLRVLPLPGSSPGISCL